MPVLSSDSDSLEGFIFELLCQAVPLLLFDGIPLSRLLDFLSVNNIPGDTISDIIHLRGTLNDHKYQLMRFIPSRISAHCREMIHQTLNGNSPCDADRTQLTFVVITLAATYLNHFAKDRTLNDLVPLGALGQIYRLILDIEDQENSITLDISDVSSFSHEEGCCCSTAKWKHLPLFANPRIARFFFDDF